MKTTRIFMLRSSLFVMATLLVLGNLLLGSVNANAQSAADAQAAAAQSSSAQAASTALSTPIIKPAARITQKIDEAKLAPLHTRVHPLARAEFDRGVVPDSQPMNRMLLVLQRSDAQETALRNLLDEQQTKNSPNYHAWLTPATFGQQFGVADEDVQAVTSWLTQKGFTGIIVHPGNMFIEFSGSAGTVRNAFHTEIHQFSVKGEMHMANVSVPQIPAALSSVVREVHSLHTFRKKSFLHFSKALEQAKAKATAKGPQFTFADVCPNPPNGNQPCAAVGPGDFAKIYNLPSNLDGTGQTIALVARSNVAVSDINQFGTAFGISNLGSFSEANNVVLTGPDPGLMPGDQDEATLDVEWSGAVAPKAKILLVPSDIQASTFADGVDLSSVYIVANNLAQILSQSFGSCENGSTFESALWEQAASQGISVFVSTGDTGSAACDPDLFNNASDLGLAISGSASTEFNVAVGGTDFDDASNPGTFWNTSNSGTGLASAISYIPEITWNGGCAATATSATLNTACANINPQDPSGLDLSGGAGGQSSCGFINASNACQGNPKPAWQQLPGLTGMPADGVRDIPDVSLFAAVNTASNQFYIICEASSPLQNGQPCSLSGANLNFSGVGGTSASTPAFAGIIALVNQNEVNNNRLKAGEGQGNVNYVLYKLAVAQYATAGLNCNSSTGPAAGCTFNDVTKGNNSVPCVGTSADGTPPNGTTPNCSTQTANTIGVLVETTSATTPGWSTTAGYDLATGLGSVNVTNLVANWPTVTTNYKATTSTVTSTVPANLTTPAITHGADVTFNISVTSGSGTPTGDVTLVPQPGVPGAQATIFATLSSGTAQIVTNMLPGGTYPIVVHYSGDGTFAPSDSAPVTITISKENSSSALSMWEFWNFPASTQLTPASAPYGSQYLFRVDVIGSQNGDNQICSQIPLNAPPIPCPTGKVTFTADGNPLNDFINSLTGTATNGAALNPFGWVEDRVLGSNGLNAGSHSIAASYAGDNSYNSSNAPALAITITPASTQTAVTVGGQSTSTVTVGQQVNLVATIGTLTPLAGAQLPGPSAGAGPTGSVAFSACGTAGSCTVPVVPTSGSQSGAAAFATATLPTTFTTAGTQNITATFTSGDGNYNSCTTAVNTTTQLCTLTPLALMVNAAGAPAKLAFMQQPTNVATGAAITPAVTVAVEDAAGNVVTTATNAVTIAIGTNPGSGTLGGTLTAAPTNGVATFSNLTISAAGTGYTLVASGAALTSATSNPFNVTGSGTGSFTISAPANATTLSSTSGASVGTTITVTPSNGFTGMVAVAASALPSGVTCPNSPVSINVTGATAVTGTLNCQVTAHSSGLTASNFLMEHDGMLYAKAMSVTKTPNSDGSNGKGWWALSAGTGFAALFLIFIPGGRKRLHAALGLGLICLLTLTLGCNGTSSGSSTPVPTTTSMTVNADTEPSGTAFTFSVSVTGGTPTGMVQLFDGATMIGTAAAVSGGKAAPTAPALSVGTHAISAHYLGDTKTQASQSGTLNLTSTGNASFTITGTSGTNSATATVNVAVQ